MNYLKAVICRQLEMAEQCLEQWRRNPNGRREPLSLTAEEFGEFCRQFVGLALEKTCLSEH